MVREICQDLEKLFNNPALRKRYALQNQMDRSSGSIMDNIADGLGRGKNLEFRNFLGFARSSCAVLRSQLSRTLDKELITPEQFKDLDQKCDKIKAFHVQGSVFKCSRYCLKDHC
ncbi:four helix bundle protein [Gillisia sp. Hel_I_86]|uniref:four helix bundle protein n=1 Tax=Gillisia sp. Hel_I_86 TaxID=1249981 RepID=UPI00119CDE7C